MPGEKPFIRAGLLEEDDARGGEPIGPKSTAVEASLIRRGAEGAWVGRGAGDPRSLSTPESCLADSAWEDCSGSVVEAASAEGVPEALPWAGALGSVLLSSGRPDDAKSVSLTGGAGAEGERVAFRGMGIGGRALPVRGRVGAVEPERRGLRDWAAAGPPW